MPSFIRLLFGHAKFRESEKFLEFQYKLLAITLLSGALFTSVFFVGEVSCGIAST